MPVWHSRPRLCKYSAPAHACVAQPPSAVQILCPSLLVWDSLGCEDTLPQPIPVWHSRPRLCKYSAPAHACVAQPPSAVQILCPSLLVWDSLGCKDTLPQPIPVWHSRPQLCLTNQLLDRFETACYFARAL